MLHEYPDFIFNHNEALFYQWLLKYDPDLFAEIQKRFKAGRWFISDGCYLQPDVNLPGTQSIIRHIVEGRRFFKAHFGVQPKVAYNFDLFGQSSGLPQIFKQAGYKMYIHLCPESNYLDLPADLYRWHGVDGSEIIGCRIAVGLYHTEYNNIEQWLKEGVKLALKLKRNVPVFRGIGNYGGGATRDDLEKIKKNQLLCEIPGGIITRPADGEEHVQDRWLMLEGEHGAATEIINSGRQGLDFKDGETLILRLQEAGGIRTESIIQLVIPQNRIELSFQPLEIKTLRIERSGRRARVNMINENYKKSLSSFNFQS